MSAAVHPAQVTNLARLLTHTARLFPEHTALIQGEQRWTWAQIEARVDALVAALQALGLKKGDRILLQSRNNLALFESGWAAFRMGCVWVPTNFRLTPGEVAYLGESSGAVLMLVEPLFAEHAAALRAASNALRQVVWIGGDSPTHAATHAATPSALSYEALVQQHLGAATAEVTVAHDDPLWFFSPQAPPANPRRRS